LYNYEIRILNGGKTKSVIEVVHLNDHAAIRAGKKFAEGNLFEVWRGLDCVYGSDTAMRETRSRTG
jgi:hypothetical protein